jgi:DNA-binding GntR family transcriptional regulator
VSHAATRSKADLAYDAIRERIVDGSYAPGSRLIFDQIARDLAVSPVPVREAVRRLEAEGYVVIRRNIGAEVASIDPARYAETMAALAIMEGAATALAAPHLTAADLAAARAINDRLAASLHAFDPLAFTRLNHEFHEVLYGRCRNGHLLGIIESEWRRLAAIRRTTFAFVPSRAQDAVAEHARLLAFIEAGAPSREIENHARHHRTHTVAAFQQWNAERAMSDGRDRRDERTGVHKMKGHRHEVP